MRADSEWDLETDLHALLAPLTESAPCLISVIWAGKDAEQMSYFESHIVCTSLGSWWCGRPRGHALEPDCSTDMFDWMQGLVQGGVLVPVMPTHLLLSAPPYHPPPALLLLLKE
jgi:hypothetical protein